MMLLRFAPVLALLLVLSPGPGRAQSPEEAPGDVPVAGAPESAVTAPPLTTVEEAVPEPSAAQGILDTPRALGSEARRGPLGPAPLRGVLEMLGGGVVGTASGLAVGLLAASGRNCDFDDDCAVALVFGFMGGAALGVPLGVYGTGRLLGVRGSLGAAYLGLLLGGGLGLGGALALNSGEGNSILAVPAGALLGSVLLFELTDDGPGLDAEAPAPSGLRLAPVMGPTPRGGFMGGFSARF